MSNYCKPLADILRKAQGHITTEGIDIDIGGEVVTLRRMCDEFRTNIAEKDEVITALRQVIREMLEENLVNPDGTTTLTVSELDKDQRICYNKNKRENYERNNRAILRGQIPTTD